MAVRPDYTTGTLTLVADSVNFATAGSALQTIAGVREGDKLITVSGHCLKIATITGDNAGTLAYICPAAAAGAAQPLRVEFQPDGARYSAKTAQLIELLGNGNLEDLAAIEGAANTVLWFDSPSSIGLTALTAFARSLLGDADAAAALTRLGGTGVGKAVFAAANAVAGYDALTTQGANILAAAAINLNTATGAVVDVTGNAGITAVTLGAGKQRMVRFTGTPLITVGASLVGNNGGANIQVEAGDMAVFEGYAGNVVRFWLARASGRPVSAMFAGGSITGASFDGGVIGGTTPGAGTFTTGQFNYSAQVGTFSATGATGGVRLSSNGVTDFSRDVAAATNLQRYYNPNGLVGYINTYGTATQYATSSDERLKDFIGVYDPLEALAVIRADPTQEFTWKTDGTWAVGWGAQTSYAVSPDLASPGGWINRETGEPCEEADENAEYIPWGVDQGKRTPYLWAVVPWLSDKLEAAVSQIAVLETRLDAAGL